jgi:hypothetical protein
MGQSYSSGQTAVNGTVTTQGTFTPVKLTIAVISATAANNTQTLGTVPANKKWHIIGINITSFAGGATNHTTSVLLNDINWVQQAVSGSATTNGHNQETTMFDYSTCPQLTTGQTVKLNSNAATSSCTANVYYYEESV